MKKILITGKGSYIGTHFRDYLLNNFPDDYCVDELDMVGNGWKNHDFSGYDAVYHVAGLAHSTPDESQKSLYYKVNTELAYDTACKAKAEGVRQFIFMSSIIVYGSGKIGEPRIITKDTPLTPDNFYGDSKKQAEIRIRTLESDEFKVCIIRPPMIYGPGSKGNYPLLAKFAKKTPVFPTLHNERSMLFIGNLVEFVRLMVENEEAGVFLPQNDEYVSTGYIVKMIAGINGHRVLFTGIFNLLIKVMKKEKHINKLFGNFVIDKKLSDYGQDYRIYSLVESIVNTEKLV